MKKEFINIGGKEYPRISDITLIGDWEEVTDLPATTISKELDNERLNGLILRGYEMKWDVTNENGERYEQTAFDGFINDYFVSRKLNMVVDINHEGWHNWQSQCGRVLYIERNSVGFYFVIYVPRAFDDYENLLWRLKEGIIQGFSKEGYATDWEYKWKEDGTFDYEIVREMKLLSVSLVSTPANGIAFEKMQEVKNALHYVVKDIQDKAPKGSTLAAMFNK